MRFQDLLDRGAHRTPDAVALRWIDRGRALTYAQAAAGMEQAAGALARLGVSASDRVGLFAHNSLDYLLAMFGAWRLGASVWTALSQEPGTGTSCWHTNRQLPPPPHRNHAECTIRYCSKCTLCHIYSSELCELG